MIDFNLFEGDLLIVDRSLEVRTGDIILANLDNEFTGKMLEITVQGRPPGTELKVGQT